MRWLLCTIWLLLAAIAGAETPGTLRVDYYHTGNALTETFSLHQVVVEPLAWPGNPRRTVDNTNRGYYLAEMVAPITGEILYSRGYSSIFGEWQWTGEAKTRHRTFHESVRLPMPDKPVRLRISKRDDANRFAFLWSADIDPADMLVVRAHPPLAAGVEKFDVLISGAPADKVDYLIIGDGYTAGEAQKFEHDARRLTEHLFSVSPFKERRADFNVRAIYAPANASGTNRPSNGTYRHSVTGTTYDAFRSERYILAFDNLGLRQLAQHVPYEFVLILANSETYGGGGIYGLYSTAAADSDWAGYLVVHELGHHFAALADEYYTSANVYESAQARPEPWEPNVTAFHDKHHYKWADQVNTDTPQPTPWPKQEFEEFQRENQARRQQLRADNRPEAEMNALFRDEQQYVTELFSAAPHSNDIGVFEGANYEATGYYRSEMNCLMFTRHDSFCAVCRDAIEDIIDLYSR